MSPYQLQHDFRVYECLLYSGYFPMWYPGSGVVLDCIVSLSLPSLLLSKQRYSENWLLCGFPYDALILRSLDTLKTRKFIFLRNIHYFNLVNGSNHKHRFHPWN